MGKTNGANVSFDGYHIRVMAESARTKQTVTIYDDINT